jgi:hypothetical protein
VISLPPKCRHRDISLLGIFFLCEKKLFFRQSSWVVSDFFLVGTRFGIVSAWLRIQKLHYRPILFADRDTIHRGDDSYRLRFSVSLFVLVHSKSIWQNKTIIPAPPLFWLCLFWVWWRADSRAWTDDLKKLFLFSLKYLLTPIRQNFIHS